MCTAHLLKVLYRYQLCSLFGLHVRLTARRYSKQYQEDARTHAKAQQEIGKVYTNSIAPSFFDQFGRSAR